MVPEEVQGFAIQQLPNATHQTFNEATLKKAQEDAVVSVRCAKYLTPYAAAVKEEDEAMVEAQASTITQAIREWDGRRDVGYDSFLKIVKAMNALPNPTTKAAAEKVLNYVNINKVNTSAQYDEETGKLTNFIQDMENYCAEELALLNLTQLLADLKEANERMKELLAERADEYADRVLSRVQKARKVVDECYRTLIKAVNCMAFLDAPETPFKPFIGYMNAEITRLKRQVLKIHVSQKEETGEESGVEAPGESETPETPPAEETQPQTYTLTFTHNGEVVRTYQYAEGDRVAIVPPAPEGYEWVGRPSTMPGHDVTVTTKWVGIFDPDL